MGSGDPQPWIESQSRCRRSIAYTLYIYDILHININTIILSQYKYKHKHKLDPIQ